jgi:branched-chain amino acid aminotransferase
MAPPQQPPFDDRDGWIWFDGELVPWRDARIHVLTHALHYASSVFEGQRAYNGVIFKLSEHSQRLRRSAELLGFELPWSVEQIDAACNEVLKANKFTDAYMRPVAWRGSESMGVAPGNTRPHLAIAAWEWGKYFDPTIAAKGIRLEIAPWRRPAPYTAPVHSKAAGLYMIGTLSKQHAESRGYNDALMLDWRGQVAEGTGANIFFLNDGALHTPVPDCFLDGITRRTVMDLARRRGIEVVERAIWPEEMEGFQQAFLTGTAAEVTAVKSIGPYNFEVGELTLQLDKDYEDLVNGRIPNAS